MATKLSKIVDYNVRTAWVKKWTERFLKGLQNLQKKEEIELYCLEQKTSFETEVKRLSQEKANAQKKEVIETSWMNAAYLIRLKTAVVFSTTINLFCLKC